MRTFSKVTIFVVLYTLVFSFGIFANELPELNGCQTITMCDEGSAGEPQNCRSLNVMQVILTYEYVPCYGATDIF